MRFVVPATAVLAGGGVGGMVGARGRGGGDDDGRQPDRRGQRCAAGHGFAGSVAPAA